MQEQKRDSMYNDDELSLYIHIPFCVRKCGYCDFLSAAADAETRERYVQALLMEIDGYSKTEIAKRNVKTIYMGGGTPSVLTVSQLTDIFDKIRYYRVYDFTFLYYFLILPKNHLCKE